MAEVHILSDGFLSDDDDHVRSTVGFVRDADARVVIDPGMVSSPAAILDPLAALGVQPGQVTDAVLSHHHPDHTLKAALFPKARVHDHWAWYLDDLWTSRDAEGFYVHGGRSDDMIKAGGIWVSPVEVEGAVIRHPSVVECAVIAIADDDGLDKPHAYVVLRSGVAGDDATARELREFVKGLLAPYKCPRSIRFIDALPKTATGKIKRFELRKMANAVRRDAARSPETTTPK